MAFEGGNKDHGIRHNNPSSNRVSKARLVQFVLLFLAYALGIFVLTLFQTGNNHQDLSEIAAAWPKVVDDPSSLDDFPTSREEQEEEEEEEGQYGLMHGMNDTELMQRAGSIRDGGHSSFGRRTSKIAFMFLTRGPLPLAALWERFFHGQDERLYSIYVHSSPHFVPNFSKSSVFYGRQIPSQAVEWGRITLCDAMRRLLANALLNPTNQRFILLSESCIPLHNFTTIFHYISTSRHSFVAIHNDLGPTRIGRYNASLFRPEVTRAQWRKGSQWFEANRQIAVEIVSDTKYYPKFRGMRWFSDEHYFHTMLSIEMGDRLANRTLTWTNWTGRAKHPRTFRGSEIGEELFGWIMGGKDCVLNGEKTSVCYLFARKFARSALEPLLELSARVFGY